ncbi:fam-a protein [Plasmodium yoelii]|uniref:Fam-a protein n=2 Tax=Plasmodium yoelii TaxID=5861 RepID=A0AAE9WPY4_PLAYO|nr:fam-a protein [Plasmodium yoelii]WBY57731.1 fam-a protein [Plasmodium yoelii yoelii]CDU84852.1 fam-a protein [Plasmodium yoelii]VTZ78748.1 fam-a protein [Plasmodium yoelii]|eukprot:XP_022813234.1 fam-a protein [Plasmodium yoelii]
MNKPYIQIVLFLLNVSIYVNNKTLATEPAPGTSTPPESISESIQHYSTPEEIYEKNKHLLCTNPEETIQAGEVMNEAVSQLEYHATSIDDYEFCNNNTDSSMLFYNKKYQGYINIEKIHFKVDDPNNYNEIINMLWDPDCAIFFNMGFVKITRVYNPNLVMIQQRYKKKIGLRQRYFYALITKVEISENKAIVVMTSANINDHNPSNETYINEIVKSANLFKTDIDSEEDIRKGKLKKTFVNLIGYLIEKRDRYIHVVYIDAIDGHGYSFLNVLL